MLVCDKILMVSLPRTGPVDPRWQCEPTTAFLLGGLEDGAGGVRDRGPQRRRAQARDTAALLKGLGHLGCHAERDGVNRKRCNTTQPRHSGAPRVAMLPLVVCGCLALLARLFLRLCLDRLLGETCSRTPFSRPATYSLNAPGSTKGLGPPPVSFARVAYMPCISGCGAKNTSDLKVRTQAKVVR
jgi:hypothetical protein